MTHVRTPSSPVTLVYRTPSPENQPLPHPPSLTTSLPESQRLEPSAQPPPALVVDSIRAPQHIESVPQTSPTPVVTAAMSTPGGASSANPTNLALVNTTDIHTPLMSVTDYISTR